MCSKTNAVPETVSPSRNALTKTVRTGGAGSGHFAALSAGGKSGDAAATALFGWALHGQHTCLEEVQNENHHIDHTVCYRTGIGSLSTSRVHSNDCHSDARTTNIYANVYAHIHAKPNIRIYTSDCISPRGCAHSRTHRLLLVNIKCAQSS